ncbi:MAG: glutamate decarboxylase [Candidatus Xenobiia bacterium LiM19]
MLTKKLRTEQMKDSDRGHTSTYSGRYFRENIPKYEIPKNGMPSNAAYQLIHDELSIDANPALNLSSFVTTWMEPEAEKLIMENLNVNFIDSDMYPQSQIIHERCVNMIARLFNSPEGCDTIGTATLGSSEAVMLAGLAHKWKWRARQIAAGKPADKPNLVCGADVQVCWDKFARYFDVDMRIIPMEKDCYVLKTEKVAEVIDENTILVVGILGTTFTGQYDPLQELNDLLITVKKEKGWDIPLHIDGASGAFVVPFIDPGLLWDFRLSQVKSINASGHKYGLVYPGIGWLLFRDRTDFPNELVFDVNYLGGTMPTFTLNFSRGSAPIIAQYYNFLRLGRKGYCEIMSNLHANTRYLTDQLIKTGKFEMVGRNICIPAVTLSLNENIANYTVYDISERLRERGWVVSAYSLPPNAQDISVLRIVVREHFSRDMADILLKDIEKAVTKLETQQDSPKMHRVIKRHHRHC